MDLAAQGDCSFYRKCVETKMYCGDNGYAINYGERYCKRFEEYHNCFNIEVCTWKFNPFYVRLTLAFAI